MWTAQAAAFSQTHVSDNDLSSWLGSARVDSNNPVTADDWCHVVLVSDLADQELRFYLNGTLAYTESGIVTESTTGNYILASRKTGVGEFLTGLLDEVAVFDFQLDDLDGDGDHSDSRIPAHYAAFLQDATPLLAFEAAQLAITQGISVDLTWKVSDAAATIEIDNGVGDVTGNTSGGSGAITVSPSTATTYTITVNGTETLQVDR